MPLLVKIEVLTNGEIIFYWSRKMQALQLVMSVKTKKLKFLQ